MDTATTLETPPVDMYLASQALRKIGVADMKGSAVRTLIGDDERPSSGAGEFRPFFGRLPTAIRRLSITSLCCRIGRLLSHLGMIILRTFTPQTSSPPTKLSQPRQSCVFLPDLHSFSAYIYHTKINLTPLFPANQLSGKQLAWPNENLARHVPRPVLNRKLEAGNRFGLN